MIALNADGARAGALVDSPPLPAKQLLQAAEAAIKETSSAWMVHARGLAHLRDGNLDAAAQAFEESNRLNWGPVGAPLNALGLALVHAKRNQSNDARRHLAEALAKARELKIDSPVAPPGWRLVGDSAEYYILLREAEALFARNPAP
jgi:hypothetical protein